MQGISISILKNYYVFCDIGKNVAGLSHFYTLTEKGIVVSATSEIYEYMKSISMFEREKAKPFVDP